MSNNENTTIGLIAPGWPPEQFHNGIVTYVKNITEGCRDIGIQTRIFSYKVNSSTDRDLIDLKQYHRPKGFVTRLGDYFKSQSQNIKSINEKSARCIISAINQSSKPINYLEMEESFGVYYPVSKQISSTVIVRLHGPYFLTGIKNNLIKSSAIKKRIKLEGEGLNDETPITAPSRYVLDKTRDFYDKELLNARVIPNPVSLTTTEKRWSLQPDEEQLLLYVGRFESLKGGDLVIDAFRMIAAKNTNVKLIFIGPDVGIKFNGQLIKINEYIKNKIPEVNIRQRINYLGTRSHEQIDEYRKKANVTIISSRFENFPMALLEALSAGCPVVATAVGGIKEIIEDGYNGLLAEPENPESIADLALKLINNTGLMEELSKNAVQDCELKYLPSIIAKQTIDYYNTLK